MVATDTVVGIVGAILLVGVMAGVYIYEFNNVDDGDLDNNGGNGAMGVPAFLDADGDIDGDGTPNGEDDDVDGDGIANADDDKTAAAVSFTGSFAAGPAASNDHPVTFEEGVAHFMLNITYDALLPAPAPTAPGLSVSLLDPEGGSVATGTGTTDGSTVTLVIDTTDVGPGDYTVRVTVSTGGAPLTPAVSYSAEGLSHYDA
ncbi:MAG: hypothetical protein ACPGQL_06245 [Thermoplasmatota archaeon]